jgi:hypothetical protein
MSTTTSVGYLKAATADYLLYGYFKKTDYELE